MSKIGIFDSGLGGLSVVNKIRTELPFLDIHYLGDTARLPYGTKSAETIKNYVIQNIKYLKSQNVDHIVIACNSASSVISDLSFDIPVTGVIESGCISAINATDNLSVGVIGTRTTIKSECYLKTLKSKNSDCKVTSLACPLFVPLVEEGLINDSLTRLIVFRYLNAFKETDIDTLILGCTHYPFLKKAIQDVLGPMIKLVDGSDEITKKLKLDFSTTDTCGSLTIECTDTEDHFQKMIGLFSNDTEYEFNLVTL